MKKITFKTWAIFLLSFLGLTIVNAQDKVLPLSGVNLVSDGTKVTYSNPTITYIGEGEIWQFAGWEWAAGEDFSAYNTVVVEFDASDLPDVLDPAKIELAVIYEGSTDQEFGDSGDKLEVRKSAVVATVTLKSTKGKVKRIFLKSQYAGTIELIKAYATEVKDSDIPLWKINWQDEGKWDYLTKTISNIDACDSWRRITMDNLNKNIVDYAALVLEFDNMTLDDACTDNPTNFLQLIAETNKGTVENSSATTTTEEGITTTKTAPFPEDATTIKHVHIKLRDNGTANLIRMYLEPKEIEEGISKLTDDRSTIVGYYSILGVKFSAEPTSGVFIVKYANGKAVKMVK